MAQGCAVMCAGPTENARSFNKFTNLSTSLCKQCNKRVYEMEKILADQVPYHKTCFKCTHCNRILSLGNYAAIDGSVYCKPHFLSLFKVKGNYNEGFGLEKKGKSSLAKHEEPAATMRASEAVDVATETATTEVSREKEQSEQQEMPEEGTTRLLLEKFKTIQQEAKKVQQQQQFLFKQQQPQQKQQSAKPDKEMARPQNNDKIEDYDTDKDEQSNNFSGCEEETLAEKSSREEERVEEKEEESYDDEYHIEEADNRENDDQDQHDDYNSDPNEDGNECEENDDS